MVSVPRTPAGQQSPTLKRPRGGPPRPPRARRQRRSSRYRAARFALPRQTAAPRRASGRAALTTFPPRLSRNGRTVWRRLACADEHELGAARRGGAMHVERAEVTAQRLHVVSETAEGADD
eukprot:6941493-Prymnesium_polylepis.1